MKHFSISLALLLTMVVAIPTTCILVLRKHKKQTEMRKTQSDSLTIKIK